jgi:microcystin-dependent protein
MDPILGSIQLFAFNFVPKGWALCDGSLLPISQNQAVFALVGTTYGGDGMSTFALPNLKGKEPVAGAIWCICVQGVFPQRL